MQGISPIVSREVVFRALGEDKRVSLLTDADAYCQASEACRKYMEENLGSTDIIIRTVES